MGTTVTNNSTVLICLGSFNESRPAKISIFKGSVITLKIILRLGGKEYHNTKKKLRLLSDEDDVNNLKISILKLFLGNPVAYNAGIILQTLYVRTRNQSQMHHQFLSIVEPVENRILVVKLKKLCPQPLVQVRLLLVVEGARQAGVARLIRHLAKS